MHRFFCMMVLFSLSFSWADGERKHLKIYPIGDLVGLVSTASPLMLEQFPEKHCWVTFEEPRHYRCSPDELLDMLHLLLSNEDDVGTFLRISENRLFANLSKSAHQNVEQFLQDLRRDPLVFVTFKVHFLEVSEKSWKELFHGKTTQVVLDEKQLEALFAQEKLQYSVQISTLNMQTVQVFSGTRSSYIGDYNVEVASQSSIGDPIILEHLDGLRVNLKGTIGNLGEGVLVEGQCLLTETLQWKVTDLSSTHLGPISQPETKFYELQVFNWIKMGETLAVSHLKGEARWICLIQPSSQISTLPAVQKKE